MLRSGLEKIRPKPAIRYSPFQTSNEENCIDNLVFENGTQCIHDHFRPFVYQIKLSKLC